MKPHPLPPQREFTRSAYVVPSKFTEKPKAGHSLGLIIAGLLVVVFAAFVFIKAYSANAEMGRLTDEANYLVGGKSQ